MKIHKYIRDRRDIELDAQGARARARARVEGEGGSEAGALQLKPNTRQLGGALTRPWIASTQQSRSTAIVNSS